MNLDRGVTVAGGAGPVRVDRDPHGVARIQARDEADLALGIGIAHALDRWIQMDLVRLVAQGRLAECLAAGAQTEGADRFMRRLGLARHAAREVADLDPPTRAWLEAYVRGVNLALGAVARPMELWAIGRAIEPWTPADTLATVKLMSFHGLAQSQGDAEKLILQALRAGADPGRLARLFEPYLDGLDAEVLEAVAGVRVVDPLVPEALRELGAVPSLRSSNNWVVAAGKSATGAPLIACDPHLEVNRLPPVWYEILGELPDDFRIGITMPGLPGLAMGRSSRTAAGFTYGSMDMIDWFVEDCADGCWRAPEGRVPFERRVETVAVKGGTPFEVEIFENRHGVLEGDPRRPGKYLCMAWSGARTGAAGSLAAMRRMGAARTVDDVSAALASVAVAGNWLMADRDGRIAYRQTGLLPDRVGYGLRPRLGWRAADEWRGLVDPDRLLRRADPPEGFLATANDRFQAEGEPHAITLSAGRYRARRIRELLAGLDRVTVDDMKRIQSDLRALQVDPFLARLLPRLPASPARDRLAAWDRTYRVEAPEPLWFEEFYARLTRKVFGPVFTAPVWDHMAAETGMVDDLHEFLDDALLGGDPRWFDGDPDAAMAGVLGEVLSAPPPGTWGDRNRVAMRNILFQGRLPAFLGFDVPDVPIPGGRSTAVQGRVYRSHGRATSFVPSWRFVADLAGREAWTQLPGGPSARRFSGWYLEGIDEWRRFEYKRIGPGPS